MRRRSRDHLEITNHGWYRMPSSKQVF